MVLTNVLNEAELAELGANEDFLRAVNSPLFFSKLLVEDKGEVIAASCVRITSEISMFFGKDAGFFARTKALKKILEEQIPLGKSLGIDQVQCFTNINKGLMKHLGFKYRDEKAYILHF